jgi:hypothetical protein
LREQGVPLIFEGCCSACGAVTPRTSGFYRAVYLDEPTTSAHVHPEDPHLVILAHPVESLILQETGCTDLSATLGGRLVSVVVVFCLSCGHLFEIRRLTAGFVTLGVGGCLGALALSVAMGVALSLWIGGALGVVAGVAGVGLLLVLLDWLVWAIVRVWHRDRARQVATPCECPHCGGHEYAPPRIRLKAVPCVACGKRAVEVRCVGVS